MAPHDILWDVLGDRGSESYLKSQGTIEEYNVAVKVFLGRLRLVIRGLHLDQLMVIFRATTPNWYSTATKAEKVAMGELFEVAQNWVEIHLVGKMKGYSGLWYESAFGKVYYEAWQFAK